MKSNVILLGTAIAMLSSTMAFAATVEAFKTSGCGCCEGWVAHARDAGFDVVTRDVDMGEMAAIKAKWGIQPDLASCHTSTIEGYVIEGHVPSEDIARLLAERPDGVGLAAPGMPAGSPGMGAAGSEAYDVLLLSEDGSTSVFARH